MMRGEGGLVNVPEMTGTTGKRRFDYAQRPRALRPAYNIFE